MKALVLAAGAATAFVAIAADASVLTVGGSLARACYQAADAHDARPEMLQTCDRAFEQEALTERDRVATHINRGILRMLRGDSPAAQSDFDQAVRFNPNQPEAWLNMAILKFNQGDNQRAQALFERAIRLRTQDPALAYLGRGLAYEQAGNVKAAYADLVRASQLAPGWALPKRELRRYQVVRR